MKLKIIISISLSVLLFQLPVHAAYTIKEGRLLNVSELATMSVQEHYSAAVEAYQKQRWDELAYQSNIVIKNFPSSPFALDSYFYLGAGFFHRKEYELANQNLTLYLKKQTSPKFFEEAIKYKFAIADKYQNGAKRHLLGWESMPKWMPAREEAIAIYDEVIAALPHHELAAQALFGKAKLLLKDDDYKASVETYQSLIRKFPKHKLACESYVGIGEVYFLQCNNEYPDPDYLDLAEINVRKFKQDFSNDVRVGEAERMLLQMKEKYAEALYETAQFYERTKKAHASMIYYSKIVSKYPQTKIAQKSGKRLVELQKKLGKGVQFPENAPEEMEPSGITLPPNPSLTVSSEEPSTPQTGLSQTQQEETEKDCEQKTAAESN